MSFMFLKLDLGFLYPRLSSADRYSIVQLSSVLPCCFIAAATAVNLALWSSQLKTKP